MFSKEKRIKKLLHKGKMLCVPLDHGVTNADISHLSNFKQTANDIIHGGASSIIIHKGLVRFLPADFNAGLIVHLSASTESIRPVQKIIVCEVEEAIRLGADAVSVHVNLHNDFEKQMIQDFAKISKECNDNNLPLLAMMWNSLLYDWMGDQISKKSKNVSIENKLFLNFICKTKIDWHDNLVKYDIEHIIPKKRISAKKLDVAVSAIGNLCLLPSCDNRRKKEETVYEYLDRTSEITTINETKALNLYYPTRDELVFIRAGSAFNMDNYERFLKDRSNYLIREFLKLVE